MSSLAGPSTSLPPKPPPATHVRSHLAHTSIRAQTAKSKGKQPQAQAQGQAASNSDTGTGGGVGGVKQGQTNKQLAQVHGGQAKGKGKAVEDPLGSKEIVKAVLANPLMPRWPDISLPNQTKILNHLCSSLPGVQAYHISRDRCNRKRKNEVGRRGRGGRGEGVAGGNGVEEEVVGETVEVNAEGGEGSAGTNGIANGSELELESTSPGVDESRPLKRKPDEPLPISATKKPRTSSPPTILDPPSLPQQPQPPEILHHMVIGINEVMKRMEKQMMALKEDFYAGEALGDIDPDSLADGFDVNITNGISNPTSSPNKSYIRIIFVCLPDINPPHLVSPIPQYCTSWNSLIHQCRTKLQRVIRGKTKEELKGRRDVEVMTRVVKRAMEVLVVPLAEGAEFELAKVMGLRRVAVMALTTTFPNLNEMLQLLLNASLKPLTPPFPLQSSSSTTTHPYTPLHLKAISTTTPTDPKSKKAARLLETREKRKETTEKRKNQNEIWRRDGKLIKHGEVVAMPRKKGKGPRPPVFTEEDGVAEYVAGINVQM